MSESVTESAPTHAAEQPLVRVTDVTKVYESEGGVVMALRGVSLEIAAGELVAIVGASGSGKSTLMNVLGCLDRPTSGTYELAGVELGQRGLDARAVARNRVIGFVFQGFHLLSRTTALENVELPLLYRGLGRRERRAAAIAALEAVGLGDRLHHTPNQLSGGQQQRVAIARALVTNPPLILADEPTGNLDTRTSYEVLALLQELQRTRGITVVLVTHEPEIAACADRVITVRDGRILSDVRHPARDARAALAALPPLDTAAERGAGAEHARRLPALPSFGAHTLALVAFALGTAAAAAWAHFTFQKVAWPAPLLGGLALEMVALRKHLPARDLAGSTGHCLDVALRQTLANLLVVLPFLWWRGLEIFPGVWGERWRAALFGPLPSALGVVAVHVLLLLAAKQAFFELGRKGTAA
jgi:putative ABC transport system ATP-binding protein